MRLSTHLLICGFSLFVFFLGCDNEDVPLESAQKSIAKSDDWLISGKITNDGFANGEVVALGTDGKRYRSLITNDESFGLELPGNSTYAIYFLPPPSFDAGALSSGKKDEPAILQFEDSSEVRDTLRLPHALLIRDLDLGEIDIKKEQAFPTINPATKLDYDNDGINDFADGDDQNDGINDHDQRRQLEAIEICHVDAERKRSTHTIPLPQLFTHSTHGDTVGPCRFPVNPSGDLADTASATRPAGTNLQENAQAQAQPQELPPEQFQAQPVEPAAVIGDVIIEDRENDQKGKDRRRNSLNNRLSGDEEEDANNDSEKGDVDGDGNAKDKDLDSGDKIEDGDGDKKIDDGADENSDDKKKKKKNKKDKKRKKKRSKGNKNDDAEKGENEDHKDGEDLNKDEG